jgi:hypothetical protein
VTAAPICIALGITGSHAQPRIPHLDEMDFSINAEFLMYFFQYMVSRTQQWCVTDYGVVPKLLHSHPTKENVLLQLLRFRTVRVAEDRRVFAVQLSR